VRQFITVRHRVAIAGVMVDDITGKPLAGARLEITTKPPAYAEKLAVLRSYRDAQGEPVRSDTTYTRGDGLFFFLDLPAGDYGLVGFLPRPGAPLSSSRANNQAPDALFARNGDKRYGKGTFQANVTYGDEGFKGFATFRLPPTGVRGRVVSSVNQSAVLLAEVRVKGSGERAFTDAEGRYALLGIWPDEKEERVLQVRARGYREGSAKALVAEPGTCEVLPDITLVPERG
jgi:hypothetical protein